MCVGKTNYAMVGMFYIDSQNAIRSNSSLFHILDIFPLIEANKSINRNRVKKMDCVRSCLQAISFRRVLL